MTEIVTVGARTHDAEDKQNSDAEWRLKFPGTAAILDRLNAEARAKRQAVRDEQLKRQQEEQARKSKKMSHSTDGRIELAKLQAKRMREWEVNRRGETSAASEANKAKRAAAREEALKEAARKKQEQENQGRGGSGGGKKGK